VRGMRGVSSLSFLDSPTNYGFADAVMECPLFL